MVRVEHLSGLDDQRDVPRSSIYQRFVGHGQREQCGNRCVFGVDATIRQKDQHWFVVVAAQQLGAQALENRLRALDTVRYRKRNANAANVILAFQQLHLPGIEQW